MDPHFPTKPANNKNYQKDLKISIELNRWISLAMGTWPRSTKYTAAETFLARSINTICYFLMASLMVPCMLHIIVELKDFYYRLRYGGAFRFLLMVTMKYIALIFHEDDIRDCIERIKQDWRNVEYPEDRKIMLDSAYFGRRLIFICAIGMYSGEFFHGIAMPLTEGRIVEGNLSYMRLCHPMPEQILDLRHSPVNEISFAIQTIAGLVINAIVVAAFGLAALLAMHACGQLEILINWLKTLVDGRNGKEESIDERLAKIVEHHIRVLNFIERTEEVLLEISLVEIVGDTLNICLLGYNMMTEWGDMQLVNTVTYFILLISVTFSIFIFCYVGELVAEQTTRVGEVSYMIDWHRLPEKKSLAVIMIISMSCSSPKLTAGKLIPLNIYSFGNVIRSSIMCLNLIRTMSTSA